MTKLMLSKHGSNIYRLLPWWVELVEIEDNMTIIFLESLAAFSTREAAEAWMKEQQHGL